MTLSNEEFETFGCGIYCIAVGDVHNHARLHKEIQEKKSPRVFCEGRFYYAFPENELSALVEMLDLKPGKLVSFTRYRPNKLIWLMSFNPAKNAEVIPNGFLAAAASACLEREQSPSLAVLEVHGGYPGPCDRAVDDFALDRFRIYAFGTPSGLPAIQFEDWLEFSLKSEVATSKYRLSESGGGV